MSAFSSLKGWLKRKRGRPLNELLTVEFDDVGVEVRVLDVLEAGWNQRFRWSDITRVCFEDGGLWTSDVVYVVLKDREVPASIPMECRGGSGFFGALCDRGFMPEHVWRKAMGETSGGMHCWPPHQG